MKKAIYCVMLSLSITGATFAQHGSTTNSDKIFEMKPDYFSRRFQIDLGKGNKLQIELRDVADLDRLSNADSVLRTFLQDIVALKDSLSDELTAKRIDYITDSAGSKKIRLQQYKPKGSAFIVDHGDIASLKLEQDTINFNNMVSYYAKYNFRKGFTDIRYYRVSFFVNQLSDLNDYLDGRLNDKIKILKENINGEWVGGKGRRVHLKQDPSISSRQPKGYFSSPGLHYVFNISVNLQNYKNYFVPSINLGSMFYISNTFFKREIGLFWEPNFFFAKNSEGTLQTFRNDFITLTLGHGPVLDNDPRKESFLLAIFSYAYLVNRQGNFFTKHTSRLGAGRLSLFNGKMKIEPVIYFNDFFKGVTPAVRLIQGF